MAAGVLGMERTTAVPFGRCRSKPAMVRPAAMDSTTVLFPACFASGGNTSSITWGFTATTITAGGAAREVTFRLRSDAVPGQQLFAAWRRRGILDDDLLGVEAALEPAGQHRHAHVAGSGEEQRSVDLQGHWVISDVAPAHADTVRYLSEVWADRRPPEIAPASRGRAFFRFAASRSSTEGDLRIDGGMAQALSAWR